MDEQSPQLKPEWYFCVVNKAIKIAILISGQGSNARNIIERFENQSDNEIVRVLSTRENPDMALFCAKRNIAFESFDSYDETKCLKVLQQDQVDMVVLAGFLKKIGPAMLQAFPHKIINVHPSLLPKFGGKGMYGARVHKAVFDHKESKSGITIHLVNENYDEGEQIAQFECYIDPSDTAKEIESKVRKLEAEHFPETVFQFALQLSQCVL